MKLLNKEKIIIIAINIVIIGVIAGGAFSMLPPEIIFKNSFIEEIKNNVTSDLFNQDIQKLSSSSQLGNGRERDLAELPDAKDYNKISDFNIGFDPAGANSIVKKISSHVILLVGVGFCYLFAVVFSAVFSGILGSVIVALVSSGLVYYFNQIREIPNILTQLKACYVYSFATLTQKMSGTEVKIFADRYYDMAVITKSILAFDWQLKTGLFLSVAVLASILFDKRTGSYITQLEDKISEAMRYQAENNKLQTVMTDIKKIDDKLRLLSARLTSLQTLTRVISKSLDYNEVLKETLKVVQQVINAEKCSIWLLEENSNKLSLKECSGWKDEERSSFNSSPTEDAGIVGEALRNGRVMVETEHRGFSNAAEGAVMPSKACAPLKLGDKKLGIINIEKFQEDAKADQEELRMLELISTLSAVAIENSNLFKKTEMLANTDGLTKLYTRRYMEGFFEAELEKSRRYNHPLSFIISDIDHFKSFNDTYGHQIGDFVLEETAKVLKNAVRNVDLAARYGGEEFVAVLPETDYKGAFTFAERLRKLVESKVYEDQKTGQKLRVTVSIGVASYPLHSKVLTEIIKKADAALYIAKESGRNRVKVAPITKEQLAQIKQQNTD